MFWDSKASWRPRLSHGAIIRPHGEPSRLISIVRADDFWQQSAAVRFTIPNILATDLQCVHPPPPDTFEAKRLEDVYNKFTHGQGDSQQATKGAYKDQHGADSKQMERLSRLKLATPLNLSGYPLASDHRHFFSPFSPQFFPCQVPPPLNPPRCHRQHRRHRHTEVYLPSPSKRHNCYKHKTGVSVNTHGKASTAPCREFAGRSSQDGG